MISTDRCAQLRELASRNPTVSVTPSELITLLDSYEEALREQRVAAVGAVLVVEVEGEAVEEVCAGGEVLASRMKRLDQGCRERRRLPPDLEQLLLHHCFHQRLSPDLEHLLPRVVLRLRRWPTLRRPAVFDHQRKVCTAETGPTRCATGVKNGSHQP